MSVANRTIPLITNGWALPALACALFAVPAHADVMEISPSGATWIAGGPAVAGSGEVFEPAAAVPEAKAVTQAPVSAGPARWQERIAQLAAKYDLSPALLEALVWQESRWNESARSPVGARGLAQLMPATARAMGVDPDDPHANLEGGARYLRMQLDAFDGNLELALAAYNAGPGRVQKAGGIPAISETRNYVASIMSRLSDPVRR